MVVLLTALIFHDTPEMILLYFYYTRYKPPSFDLRMTALIQPFISLALALLGVVTQTIGMFRYQKLFKKGFSKWMVFISVLPIILVTPLMKITVLLSTLFSQMVTFTTGSTFDPKIQKLIGVNGSELIVEKQENEYEQRVYGFLESSPIKKWFMPRHSSHGS